MIIGNKH